ncbi:MAG: tetratricopeptide repeat protein [Deltaproteobacteria bacterium]|nr:tetratricopeptide repeat protein [Deltaproteobacteria bacterium]
MRTEFERLYPVFWKSWRKSLDEAFDGCAEDDQAMYAGTTHFNHKRFAEAEADYKRALELRSGPDGSAKSKKAGNALHSLGAAVEKQERPEEAVDWYRKAFENRKSTRPPDDFDVFRSMRGAAELLQKEGKIEEAVALVDDYAAHYRGGLTKDNRGLAWAENLRGDLLFREGRHEEALGAYTKALDIMRNVIGPSKYSLARYWHNIGKADGKLGKWDDARKAHDEAFKIRKEILSRYDPDYADTLLGLAECDEKQGKSDDALKKAQEALSIYEFQPEPDAEAIARTRDVLNRLTAN